MTPTHFTRAWRWHATLTLMLSLLTGCSTTTQLALDPPDTTPPKRLITQGPATQILIDNINPCHLPASTLHIHESRRHHRS